MLVRPLPSFQCVYWNIVEKCNVTFGTSRIFNLFLSEKCFYYDNRVFIEFWQKSFELAHLNICLLFFHSVAFLIFKIPTATQPAKIKLFGCNWKTVKIILRKNKLKQSYIALISFSIVDEVHNDDKKFHSTTSSPQIIPHANEGFL